VRLAEIALRGGRGRGRGVRVVDWCRGAAVGVALRGGPYPVAGAARQSGHLSGSWPVARVSGGAPEPRLHENRHADSARPGWVTEGCPGSVRVGAVGQRRPVVRG
jgi:hypothetical protein